MTNFVETQLPYSATELQDSLELLKIPDGLDAYLQAEAERQERDRPMILSFVVDATDVELVERAIEKAKEGEVTTRGRALVEICNAYVNVTEAV